MIFSVRRGFSIGKAQASSATCHLKSLCTMKEERRDDFLCSSAASPEEFPVLRPIVAGNNKKSSSSKVQVTPEIEKKYVHRVYDAIAPHFSSTRFSKWPKVQAFLNSLPSGSLILDAGCGNGKYLVLNPNCYFVGCDISAPLINICSDRGHEVFVADALNLPFRTGYGDAAISIAVLHHLSSESRRKKAVKELIRIVKKGGLILITVWAREQEDNLLVKKWTPLSQKYVEEWIGPGSPRTWSPSSSISLESISETEESASGEQSIYLRRESEDERSNKIKCPSSSDEPFSLDSTIKRSSLYQQDYFVPWHLPYHRAEVSGASNAVSNGFARRDDKKGAVVFDRYYHVFSEGELERLVSDVDGAVIVDRFYDKSNWCIILEKTSS